MSVIHASVSLPSVLEMQGPVMRLPSEVLSLIFVLANAPYAFDWFYFVDFRLILALVCTKWKTVAYNTIALWTPLAITRSTDPAFIEFVLAHAKQATMSVFVDLRASLPYQPYPRLLEDKRRDSYTYPPTVQEFCDETLPALFPAFAQIRSLAVSVDAKSDWHILAAQLGNVDVGTLQRFSIRVPFILEPTDPAAYFTVNPLDAGPLTGAANLTTLCLAGFLPLWTSPAIHLRLTELSLLHYAGGQILQWREVAAFLNSTSALRVLELSFVTLIGWEEGPRVQLPHLRVLVACARREATVRAIAQMDLPAIQKLRFGGACEMPRALMQWCLPMLQRIRELDLLFEDPLPSHDLQSFLGSLQLTSLDISNSHRMLTKELIRLFHESHLGLPDLDELSIRGSIQPFQAGRILGVQRVSSTCVVVAASPSTGRPQFDHEIWTLDDGTIVSHLESSNYPGRYPSWEQSAVQFV
ncbi:hypothetical protein C8R44DRAFT_866894 [Mycena epipterygia]|nr:hypothetical protein C8R44DRAFT_866894 [Mycena epipterygia]